MTTAAEQELYAELGRKTAAALAETMKQVIVNVYTTNFGPWLDEWYADNPNETPAELHQRAREGE